MICIDGNWRTAAAVLLLATGGSAMAGSLGGPLELQDEGSFFVNGQLTQSTHPGTAVGGISARVHQCRVVCLIHQALIARFVPHPEGIGEAIETRDLPQLGSWESARARLVCPRKHPCRDPGLRPSCVSPTPQLKRE